MKKSLQFSIIGFLILLALLDLFFRYMLCKKSGLIYAIHDPGKTIFHLFILPMGFYVFARNIPRLKIFYVAINQSVKKISLVLGSILILLALLIFYKEINIYCFNDNASYLPAHEIYQKDKRDSLITLRDDIYKSINKGIDSTALKEKKNLYLGVVARAKDNQCGLKHWTPYRFVAFSETILGVLYGILIFFVMFISVIGYRSLSGRQEKMNALICMGQISVIGFLLASEVLFRTYSEYYINFLEPTSGHLYNVIIIALILILFTLIYMFRKAGRWARSVFTIGYALLCSLIAFGNDVSFLHIDDIMKAIFSWDPVILLMVYIVVLLPLLFIMALDTQERKFERNSPTK